MTKFPHNNETINREQNNQKQNCGQSIKQKILGTKIP